MECSRNRRILRWADRRLPRASFNTMRVSHVLRDDTPAKLSIAANPLRYPSWTASSASGRSFSTLRRSIETLIVAPGHDAHRKRVALGYELRELDIGLLRPARPHSQCRCSRARPHP